MNEMQVNNQAMTSQMKTHDKPLELKQGEIYRATIKERGSDNEAISTKYAVEYL
ncbi:hypothetical protein KHA80_02515 [Anaerobacillus sp. HL2]|nr:hypothetical protein KHA80_02515 [Anaerobacillus sp. HL2]